MLAKQIQAASCVPLPGHIAQILASANVAPPLGRYSTHALDKALHEAGVPTSKRLELKIFLNRAGLLAD
jgi:hypothetical protein